MLAPLATVADLTDRKVDVSDGALAQTMLESASAAIRDAAGCPITQGVSTIEVEAPYGRWLDLPGGPVASVSSVAIDGAEVTDYRKVGDKLWRGGGWSDPCVPSLVTVTYTHGLATVPADIVSLVCAFAAAGMNAADQGYEARPAFLMSERIDDFYAQYATDENATADVFEVPQATRDALRRRFGGGAFVTGERR